MTTRHNGKRSTPTPRYPKSGGGNKWELIETITLEEEVSAIEKSTEPNGDAYAFRDIAVIISNVEQSTWKAQIWFTAFYDKNLIKGSYDSEKKLMAFRDDCTFATPTVKMMARIINNHNIINLGVTNPITNPGYLNGYPDLCSSDIAINNAGAVVSSLKIEAKPTAFLPNTKIDIYAIR